MNIYQVKDKHSDAEWFYRSVTAMCKDKSNPVSMTREHISLLKKTEEFPIERKSWIIYLRNAKGMADLGS